MWEALGSHMISMFKGTLGSVMWAGMLYSIRSF